MANERARQKKLAKQKKKRAEVKKRAEASVFRAPRDSAALGRKVAGWKVDGVWLGANWTDTTGMALVSGLLVRRGPGGELAMGLILVDRTCLGIKSGSVNLVDRSKVEMVRDQIAEMHGGAEPVELLTLQSIAFHAHDYARALGFTQDRDFPLEFLGPRPATLEDTPLAKPAKPLFIAGPDDDVTKVIAQLDRAVGPGNYDVVAPIGGPRGGLDDAFFDFDDGDDLDDEEDESEDDAIEAEGEVVPDDKGPPR